MAGISFPKAVEKLIVLTKQMRRVIKMTLAAHAGNALIVWSGQSRVGKTTTANQLIAQLAAIYDPENPDAFNCIHYQVGEIPNWSGQEGKRGIRSLYHKCIGRLDEGQYRTLPLEALALQLVHGLRRKNIRMIFIDEAGTLSVDAIRGMVLVRDVAENEGWPLSLVFIGMDDLPVKMTAVAQIEKRIHAWCYFQEYSLEDLFDILQKVHPHFANMSLENPDHLEQVSFIHTHFGGIPGEVLPFLNSLISRSVGLNHPINLTLLKTAYIHAQRDKESALQSVPSYKAQAIRQAAAAKKGPRTSTKTKAKVKTTPVGPIGGNHANQTL